MVAISSDYIDPDKNQNWLWTVDLFVVVASDIIPHIYLLQTKFAIKVGDRGGCCEIFRDQKRPDKEGANTYNLDKGLMIIIARILRFFSLPFIYSLHFIYKCTSNVEMRSGIWFEN